MKNTMVKHIKEKLSILLSRKQSDLNRQWPRYAIIEATNFCNLSCPVCPTFMDMQRKRGFMSFDQFKMIADDMKGKVEWLYFNFAGEPTLNKELWDMVKYAGQHGFKTFVSTNSTILREQSEKIFEAQPNKITVCLDGATKEIHEAYRRGSNFEQICESIRNLVDGKNVKNLNKMKIDLQFIVMSQNEHQIEEIKNLATKLGVDTLTLKTMSIGSSRKTKDEKIELAKKWLPENEKYNRYEISPGNVSLKHPIEKCGQYETVVILWNGDLGICCYDFNGLCATKNVFRDGGFSKIYKSKEWAEIQKKIKFKKFELCQRCNITNSRSEVIKFNREKKSGKAQ